MKKREITIDKFDVSILSKKETDRCGVDMDKMQKYVDQGWRPIIQVWNPSYANAIFILIRTVETELKSDDASVTIKASGLDKPLTIKKRGRPRKEK